jgi:hypothetical protein
MRPDLICHSVYGSDEYVEFMLKYSGVDNPFAIERDDVMVFASVNSITNPVDDAITDVSINTVDFVKRYHKYIDPKKVPETNSEKNNISTPVDNGSSLTEPNLSENNESGITIKNGRVYFGTVPSSALDNGVVDVSSNAVDSSIVECARNGVTLGQFLRATIKNENK